MAPGQTRGRARETGGGEVKWTAQDWVLAASLAGNAVLGVALFFKTALNEFFTTMIKARSARKERRRQLMIELNGRLHSFDANYFFVASSNVLKETAPTEAGREAAKRTFETVSAKHIDTLEFLAAHDLEFPAEIRKGV